MLLDPDDDHACDENPRRPAELDDPLTKAAVSTLALAFAVPVHDAVRSESGDGRPGAKNGCLDDADSSIGAATSNVSPSMYGTVAVSPSMFKVDRKQARVAPVGVTAVT